MPVPLFLPSPRLSVQPASPRYRTVQLALLMNGLKVNRPTLFCLV